MCYAAALPWSCQPRWLCALLGHGRMLLQRIPWLSLFTVRARCLRHLHSSETLKSYGTLIPYALSIAQVLRLPLFQLPQLITQLVNARVAMVRLQEYLAAPQEPPAPVLPPAQEGTLTVVSQVFAPYMRCCNP